ncbi:MAG: GNAT family N-acetyltransferase, partial [Pseudomonadota bacterium]|nr:GNAT family N-acetyltransferase [Pseudomonadota bacterium]
MNSGGPVRNAGPAAGTSARYRFRPVVEADMTLLARWFASPHVSRWWPNDDGAGIAEIREAMRSESTEPMIAELDGEAFAYVQAYAPHREEDHPYRDQPPGTLGIDQFIGEAELT